MIHQLHRALLIVGTLAAMVVRPAAAESPRVVASIPPIHGIVSAVMAGVDEAHLLLPGGTSPHGATLKPSDAHRIATADLIFWVSENLEVSLRKHLSSVANKEAVVSVMALSGMRRLTTRKGGVWDAGDAEDEGHGRFDSHVWLDADNAITIARAVAGMLGSADPANRAAYHANAERFATRAAALDRSLANALAPVAALPYVVFHDAYQYFERRYGLAAVGAIAVSPDRPPGARRLREIRAAIAGRGARCVFTEPQFVPALAETVIEGTGARLGVLDPLGAGIPPGPDHWFALMRALADALAECLKESP